MLLASGFSEAECTEILDDVLKPSTAIATGGVSAGATTAAPTTKVPLTDPEAHQSNAYSQLCDEVCKFIGQMHRHIATGGRHREDGVSPLVVEMQREREIQTILVQVREIGRHLELLCERTLYQESQIEHERVRCIKLGMKLSETMQELEDRRGRYLLCTAELASTQSRLDTYLLCSEELASSLENYKSDAVRKKDALEEFLKATKEERRGALQREVLMTQTNDEQVLLLTKMQEKIQSQNRIIMQQQQQKFDNTASLDQLAKREDELKILSEAWKELMRDKETWGETEKSLQRLQKEVVAYKEENRTLKMGFNVCVCLCLSVCVSVCV